MVPKITKLLNQRAVPSKLIKRLLKSAQDHPTKPLELHHIDTQRVMLERAYEQAKDIMNDIYGETDVAADLATYEADLATVENEYYAAMSLLNKIEASLKAAIPAAAGGSGSAPPPPPHSSHPPTVKLPTLTIKPFTGDSKKWTEFSDLFKAGVDSLAGYMDSQKLQYLKGYLEGEAARAISSLEISDANYKIAWKILEDKYQHKRVILYSHLSRLFDLKPVQPGVATSLKDLVAEVEDFIGSLRALKRKVDDWDDLLVYWILDKLEPCTKRDLEKSLNNKEPPTYKDFMEFLTKEANANLICGNERGSSTKPKAKTDAKVPEKSEKDVSKKTIAAHHGITSDECSFCKGTHEPNECQMFLKMGSYKRYELMKRKGICFNCLQHGHRTNECTSEGCQRCDRKHHPILHPEDKPETAPAAQVSSCLAGDVNKTEVLLATALVNVKDKNGNLKMWRALLDSGSQASLVTERCAQMLGVDREKTLVEITGIGGKAGAATGCVKLEMHSISNASYSLPIDCLILDRVTGDLPKVTCNSKEWSHLMELQLADPKFYEPGPIDILLGADVYAEVVLGAKIPGEGGSPVAVNSRLGWILYGKMQPEPVQGLAKTVTVNHSLVDINPLRKFQEIEDVTREIRETQKELEKDEDESLKTLDLLQHLTKDEFSFTVTIEPRPVFTKRNLLSDMTRVFDPLRLLAPVTLTAKMMFQELVALAWIKGNPQRWKTFVANRVMEIRDSIAPEYWHHVSGVENSADCASRGLSPAELKDHMLWWNRPDWLANPVGVENDCIPDDDIEVNVEEKKIVQVTLTNIDKSLIERFSSPRKLSRFTAIWLRFGNNLLNKDNWTERISIGEIEWGQKSWARVVQRESFAREIDDLQKGLTIHAKSKLRSLSPFLDDSGLLRVGGRLRHASLPYDKKQRILLPTHSHFTRLVIRHYHDVTLHGGATLTLNAIHWKYWIPNGKRTVRGIISKCITCARNKAEIGQQLMGNLPTERVTPARAFLTSGVDYAGPFSIRFSSGRGSKTTKGYVAVFVCFVTKAVHLELVSDLTSEAFIAALRRFIGRRSKVRTIFSDCGTNFVGAYKELKKLAALAKSTDAEYVKFCDEYELTWNFNPPSSPHFGGLLEAGVKSTKFHLKRVIGDQSLTFEEMSTVLIQIEACLNSRPITEMSTDPNDLSALTPGHFLVGGPLLALPEPDLSDIKMNRLSRWQTLQRMVQQLWTRWTSEYLSRLQQRNKWTAQTPNMKPGSIVIVKDDRLPPLKWKLGRIIDVHPGDDGFVRVVTVKTAEGTYKRPIVKICPLPVEPDVDYELPKQD